jgi:hypothetical protein
MGSAGSPRRRGRCRSSRRTDTGYSRSTRDRSCRGRPRHLQAGARLAPPTAGFSGVARSTAMNPSRTSVAAIDNRRPAMARSESASEVAVSFATVCSLTPGAMSTGSPMPRRTSSLNSRFQSSTDMRGVYVRPVPRTQHRGLAGLFAFSSVGPDDAARASSSRLPRHHAPKIAAPRCTYIDRTTNRLERPAFRRFDQ